MSKINDTQEITNIKTLQELNEWISHYYPDVSKYYKKEKK